MKSFFPPGLLLAEYLALPCCERAGRVRAQPFAGRLRLGLQLVDRASAELPSSPTEARKLAGAALAAVVPTAEEESSSLTRHLVRLATDVAATAYCVEAEAWLLEGRRDRARAAAILARLLPDHGSGDPLVLGRVATMLALRAWLAGDLEATVRHLEVAIRDYSEAGDARREAEVWTRTALVLERAGLVPEAREALARAQKLGRRARGPRLEGESGALLAERLADLSGLACEASPLLNPHPEHGI